MRWAAALAEQPDAGAAVRTAAAEVCTALGATPDIAFLFVSADHRPQFGRIAEGVRKATGAPVVVGVSGGGVLAGRREVEWRPGIALLAGLLPGVELHPFRFAVGEAPRDAAAWHQRVGVDPLASPSLVLLVDPLTSPVDALLGGVDAAWPGSPIVGSLASGAREPGQHALFADGVSHAGGALGVAFVGDLVIDPVVAQGSKPVGDVLTVTAVDRGVVHSLDGQPAARALDAAFAAMSPRERDAFQRAPLVGVALGPTERVPRPGEFLVRNVVGLDRARGTVAIGWRLQPGQRLQFHVRDARTSAEDLDACLAARVRPTPAGALLFACLGRGEALYGVPSHDATAVARHTADAPTAGVFGSGEIGPVLGRTHLHGLTSAIGLFRPRGWH